MVPNLLSSYYQVMKWVFPALLAVIFLQHFVMNYIQARIQQAWLERLQRHNTEGKEKTGAELGQHKGPQTAQLAPPYGKSTVLPGNRAVRVYCLPPREIT